MPTLALLRWKDSEQALYEFVVPRPPSPCLFEFVGLSVLIDPVCFVKEEIGFVDLCESACEVTHIYAFCVLVYKLIWVCVFFSICMPMHRKPNPPALPAWTQQAGVPTPARLRGASLIDLVCVPGCAVPPHPCSIKIDPSFPPIPFSLTPLCASAFMRLWIGEAHRLQQMAGAALFHCLTHPHTHYCPMNESLERKRGRGKVKCDKKKGKKQEATQEKKD